MATATNIHLEASQKPTFSIEGIGEESAKTASELLQENHEKHHIFFNQSGYHNHIVHHLLTLFALGATPTELRKGYADNVSYQRPLVSLERSIVDDMHKPERFKTYLGKEKYYRDFMVFFQDEMERRGWEDVVNEYAFKGDERADDMLTLMNWTGFLHPIIHLGFGIEFKQPAIIAEALAQAAVHDSWMGQLFFGAEKAAKAAGADPLKTKSIVQLLEDIRADKKLSSAAHWADGNKVRDGILKRAPDEMLKYASQYVVAESQLDEKTAEMINAAIFYTSTAQCPPHQVKFDFYYIHCVNCSIFFSTFLHSPSIPSSAKVRLLEWKVRTDLAMYASRRSPPLLLEEVTNYSPVRPQEASWQDVFKRVNAHQDDGHASKLVRALAHGEKACKSFEGKDGFVIKGGMWKVLGNMAIDSVEAGEPTWVRSCGFDEAWEGVPERDSARL
ncbi:hypothetical protein K458DRAFT_403332 [Lentithecium fluviatile CBS 122367]|uniref:HypA-like protein n=1 Tax=Lentithecium fluviatile CBS 122367 TaxID=1168545 RepID=A0A6G1J4E7_9PLEO|nr:hypothetical protein K458DRAFT_403332 [Lentithecium fluviatile CBS 122367]